MTKTKANCVYKKLLVLAKPVCQLVVIKIIYNKSIHGNNYQVVWNSIAPCRNITSY